MDLEAARDFLRQHHRAVLGTTHPSGRLQLSPVVVGVDEDGKAVISTRATARKTRNLERDPQAVLCVFTDGFYGPWIQAEGETEIVRLPEAMEHLIGYYRRISGEHPDWDEYRTVMEAEQRVMLRITLTHAGPDQHG